MSEIGLSEWNTDYPRRDKNARLIPPVITHRALTKIGFAASRGRLREKRGIREEEKEKHARPAATGGKKITFQRLAQPRSSAPGLMTS